MAFDTRPQLHVSEPARTHRALYAVLLLFGVLAAAPLNAGGFLNTTSSAVSSDGAQQPGTATLPQPGAADLLLTTAVFMAIESHPAIRRAEAMLMQGRSEIALAKSAWYPTLEYGVKPGYGSSYGSSGGYALVQGVIGVNQLIYDFGRTSATVDIARSTLEQQKYQLLDTTEAVAHRTAQAFIEMAASQATVEAADRQVQALGNVRQKISARVHAGLSSASDLTMADAGVERAQADRLQAVTHLEIARAELTELIGADPRRVADLASTGGLIAHLSGKEGEVDRSPAVQASRSAVAVADAKVRQAKAERFPTIRLGASHSESTGRENVGDNTWVGISVGGSYSLGGVSRHRVAAARAEREAASMALDSQRLSTRTALASAQAEAIGAASRSDAYDRMLSLNRSSRDLYWKEYTFNKRSLTEVLNAEREICLAEVARIDAIADEMMATVKADAATGVLVWALQKSEIKP